MKKAFYFLVALFTWFNFFAQSGGIYAEVNYNSFFHTSLKDFQQEFVNDITEVDVKVNDNFPANIGFAVGYKIEDIGVSIYAAYNSTGGKISYSDFSGVIRLTQPLNGYTLGGIYEIPINSIENLSFGLKASVTYSTFGVHSYNELNGSSQEQKIDFHSFDIGLGGNLIYEYPVGFVRLRSSIGFDFVYGGKLILNDDNDLFLEDNSGSPVRTGWSGLRMALGIMIPI